MTGATADLIVFLVSVFVVLPMIVLISRALRESRITVSPRTEGEQGERMGAAEGERRRERVALKRSAKLRIVGRE